MAEYIKEVQLKTYCEDCKTLTDVENALMLVDNCLVCGSENMIVKLVPITKVA